MSTLVPCDATPPSSTYVTPLLTDLYQLTMAYSYWKAGRHNERSVFDLFFRTNPFKGEFTIFAGLEEVLRFVQTFHFTASDIGYLQGVLPGCEAAFWPWLASLDCSNVKLYAMAEGTIVFPREPLIRVEGPLAICQLLETTLLNLCNFASLVATNAARMRQAVGPLGTMLEFGLRRAQGPDGAMSASRYSYMGGADGTSNVAAGKAYGIPIRGTHAHSMVCAYTGLGDLPSPMLGGHNLVELALKYRKDMGVSIASQGELAAFISFAQAFPDNFLALVDTYDTINSGVPNFCCVALALLECGHTPRGIRLDSGDLAYLSNEARRLLRECDAKYGTQLAACNIVASNDLNEAVILSLQDQGHEIDTFAIGTNLVTCQAQPALGMVFKLVEINEEPRIKLSQDSAKVTIPGAKEVYRLLGTEGVPLMDVMIRVGEPRPVPGKRLLARHPFDPKKRAYVTPSVVIPLLRLVFKGGRADEPAAPEPPMLSMVEGASDVIKAAGSAGTMGIRGGEVVEGGGGSNASSSASAAAAAAGAGGVEVASGDGKGGGSGEGSGSSSGSSSSSSGSSSSSSKDVVWRCTAGEGSLRAPFPDLVTLRRFVNAQMTLFREDHLRPLNPTPYKVSTSPELFHFLHDLLMKELPIPEME